MTNHWIDIKNADVILIMGSNAAENHPIAFKWATEAMDRGATLISVDPRFTRTSAMAHIYAPLRPGTDIAFFGGLINYVLQNNRYDSEYVLNYTNAATLVKPDFGFSDGLFSGYDEKKKAYDTSSWQYQKGPDGQTLKDPTLQDPQCVFQILKRHYSRYDPDTVSRITGTPKEDFLKVAEAYAASGQPGKVGTILYAMGQTQHTVGTQNCVALAILQLLLGNIGRAGGGVNALRGLQNVQGSTDMGLLFHMLPGYLAAPRRADHPTLADYLEKETPKTSYWANKPKFLISLLKAWWGEAAKAENDFAYDYLPKADGNYSHIPLFEAMYAGTIKGLISLGQNPAVSGPNANMERAALAKLDWLVVSELFETETAAFWRAPGVDPSTVATEVFLLPAASFLEKAGSITNSSRLIQWRHKAVEPPDQARSDLWILDGLYKAIKQAYKGSTAAKDLPILELAWDYGEEPDAEAVAKEVNGYDLNEGKLVAGFAALKDDGSTSCGNWIMSGMYPEEGKNRAASRDLADPSALGFYLGWGFSWPANRRILYNRASARPDGSPADPSRKVIWWDAAEKKWVGNDVPDFPPTKAPDAPAKPEGSGLEPHSGADPFIMKSDGKGWIFSPSGLRDGPLPEHYEPLESPVANALSRVNLNPLVKVWDADMDKVGTAQEFPIIATTYRLTEHMQTGTVSRNMPWLAEMMPEMFVEMSRSLAAAKGIKNGERVLVVSARGQVEAVALVTDRVKPLAVNGQLVEQVGLPWHWGYVGLVTGDSANVLTPHVGDPNTMIPEYKAFLCDVRKA